MSPTKNRMLLPSHQVGPKLNRLWLQSAEVTNHTEEAVRWLAVSQALSSPSAALDE